MVTINDNTIRHNIYETIYDLINANKSSWSSSSEASLIGGYPDFNSTNFPTIVLLPINVDETERVVGDNSSTKFVTVIIQIFSKGNSDLDILSDGITDMLRSNNIVGLSLGDVNEDYSFANPNESKIKVKTLTVNFKRR